LTFLKQLNKNVLLNVLPNKVKKTYSITFYTGGITWAKWSESPKIERDKALKKDWYIRWAYRNPVTGLLEKQPHIKSGVNRLKTAGERIEFMRTYKKAMIETFNEGINPFQKTTPVNKSTEFVPAITALNDALESKKNTVGAQSFRDYRTEIKRFIDYLQTKNLAAADIKTINRRIVTNYLSIVLKRTSARTRNNTRSALSAIFSDLKDTFIIDRNFIDTDIKKLATKSKTDRRFTMNQMKEISKHLQETNPHLLLYIKIVAYNFLRPIEVNRLKVSDIDLKAREMYFNQKTKSGKTKYIPNIYFNELKKLTESGKPNDYLFTPQRKPAQWKRNDKGRREFFTREFLKIKKELGLGSEYGLYSFRHNFITGTYIVLRKNQGMGKIEAVEYLMRITGHESKEGIQKYIHANDADRPDDWSKLLSFKL